MLNDSTSTQRTADVSITSAQAVLVMRLLEERSPRREFRSTNFQPSLQWCELPAEKKPGGDRVFPYSSVLYLGGDLHTEVEVGKCFELPPSSSYLIL
ncbi:hypothetical protein T265_12382 [Opisthorchis viverrini]|uniref:Uncharacterized protein n=1 Tax=Opisthorchis viverrini TaxID=6198 RepID=A0A074YTM3_OPIVI|nr:hypothetical protein T265_12382 [Opisthorchis viverrini]KER18078.1 hypothetical protein T265_12382 [Opisthorchis viverrini]